MVKRSLLQKKKQLVVKRKQLRRAPNQMVLHSTATGWWSLSLRAASRAGLMWRYGAVSPLPAQSAVKLWVGCSHPMRLVHSAVRDRGSEGSAGSDWVLGRCPQLSGRATKLKPWNQHKIFFLPALCKLCFFWCGTVGMQARNFMRQMKDGQLAFFYHSNCKEPGIAGLMQVSHSLALLMM